MFKHALLFLFLLVAFGTTYGQKPVTEKGAPVIVNKDTVFEFYTGQGIFTAKERATIISKRLNKLIAQLDFNPDSLVLKNDSAISAIMYKSDLVLAITNRDAATSELDRPQLAASYLAILRKELNSSFESNSVKEEIINILEAIAVIAVLLILIWVVNRLFRVFKVRLLKSWESRVAKLGEKGAPIGYADRLLPLVTRLLSVGRLIIIILLIYLALPITFLIFPWSKPIATQLLSYIINPLKDIVKAVIRYIPNLLTITVIYLCTRYLIKLIKFIATEISSGSFAIKNFYPDWAIPTFNIVRVLLYAFMFVVIFPYLPGSDSKIFQGVTVFLGVLFSFGSSSAISNMVAGLVLTYMRPFKIGDRVRVGEVTGDVIEKNLLITRIRTVKNEDITIPNSTILGGATTNFTSSSLSPGLILYTSITIGYDAPWKTIHELMINAALATEGILHDPKPFVYQTDLNDFNVTYQINAYTTQSHRMTSLYSLLHQNIQDKFNEAGMEIMSPHFTTLRDGNAIQIPDDYIAKDYKKPGFKIEKDK